MSAYYGPGIVPAQAASVGNELSRAGGFAFRNVLDEETLADKTAEFFPGYRDRIFPP